MNAYDGSYNGYEDVFVTKFCVDGDSLVYSTYLGGSSDDRGYGITLNEEGCAYVTGFTESHTDFPLANPYQSDWGGGGYDAIVVKFGNAVWIEGEGTRNLHFHYNLSQNYPNPFNIATEIKYTLPKDCYVKIKIYNILGQKIVTLVDGKQKIGYKTVRWNAKSFASGIYFYRLQAGDFVQTRKMVLIR